VGLFSKEKKVRDEISMESEEKKIRGKHTEPIWGVEQPELIGVKLLWWFANYQDKTSEHHHHHHYRFCFNHSFPDEPDGLASLLLVFSLH